MIVLVFERRSLYFVEVLSNKFFQARLFLLAWNFLKSAKRLIHRRLFIIEDVTGAIYFGLLE